MPQYSYKQLEEAYQKGVNKEHKPNPTRTHPMSSRQGKRCPEMPVNQTKPAQYSQDSQSDSDHEFEVTAVKSPFGKYEYVKVPFGLAQVPAYFQELMTGVLKDLQLLLREPKNSHH